MLRMIRREDALASGVLPKYAIGDRVIFRRDLGQPRRTETLYVTDFTAYGTPERWVWEYYLSWRPEPSNRKQHVLATESELLSLNEAMFHVTKASVERDELAVPA